MSSFRWALSLLVSSLSKRSSPPFFPEIKCIHVCHEGKRIKEYIPAEKQHLLTTAELLNSFKNRLIHGHLILVPDRIFTQKIELKKAKSSLCIAINCTKLRT